MNMNDGLSDNDIHSVAKDTEGFMWFGTGSGLNRYDGHTFIRGEKRCVSKFGRSENI